MHREMVIGDIFHAEYLATILIRRLATELGMSFEQLSERFYTGGVIKPRPPKPLPEGVVGWTFSGQPIYDGDWFDKQMAKGGPTVTVTVNAPQQT